MSSATLVPVSEYLASSYRPDREYIDGQLVERHVGEWDHSRLQLLLIKALLRYEESLGLLVAPGQRVQVRPERFRVPDISLVRGEPGEQILTQPPLLCIEILSPEDSMTSMQERMTDYLAFGVENIWILDPRRKKAFWADALGIHEFLNGVLTVNGAAVRISLEGLWAA